MLAGVRADTAATGRRGLVVVTGEAGIGKTWFAREAATRAAADGWAVAEGRCWPHAGAPPLWPWPGIVTEMAGRRSAALLGEGSGSAVDPERFARFSAVARALARNPQPALVVVDDLHCAERATLLLTRFLVGALEHAPVVLLLGRRPDVPVEGPTRSLLDELERDSTVVPLVGFDMQDTAAYLTAVGPLPDAAAVRTVLRATGGVPMHVARAAAHGGPGIAVADALARAPARTRAVLAIAALLGTGCTVGEVVALSGRPAAEVLTDLAAAPGLITMVGAEIVFDHDLVREAALARIEPAAMLDLHAAAAALLDGTGAVLRVARHAMAAAARSPQDASTAVEACREAATVAHRGYDYETAAELLGAAAELAAHGPDLVGRAVVLVEHADAVLACGRLAEARVAFGRAVDAAEAAGDPRTFARAVLGVAGSWVHELRHAPDRVRMLARQHAARAALPAGEVALNARLGVRLAAEAVYEGGPVQAVLDALASARGIQDGRVLAEALSLTHHALLAPDHLEARLDLADELIVVASAAGDGVLTLFGLLWRTVDLYELGDPGAERALAEVRERADTFGVATVAYIVACMDVMRLIRAGQLAEAEKAAGPCLARGLEIGDADAVGYYGAQLVVIRWLQGRDAELAELVLATAQSPTLAVPEFAFQILVGSVLARGGRLDEARAALARPLAGGIARLPRSSTWTSALVAAVEAALVLGDTAMAGEAASLLEPFADRPVMPSLGVSCLGVAARAIGLAALARGDLDAAVAAFSRAVAGNDHIRHRPAAAVCRADLADVLVRRGDPADQERAQALYAEAASAAARMDMPLRARFWSARARDLAPVAEPVELARCPGGWTLDTGTRRYALPELVGLGQLATVLTRPGHEISAAELVSAVVAPDQTLLDRAALRSYRTRLRELDLEIADAQDAANLGRLDRLQREHDAVTTELRTALGLGGRQRGFGSSAERARTSVRKAITRAIDVIAEHDAQLGAELRSSVVTGAACRYQPRPGARRWRIRANR